MKWTLCNSTELLLVINLSLTFMNGFTWADSIQHHSIDSAESEARQGEPDDAAGLLPTDWGHVLSAHQPPLDNLRQGHSGN